MSIVLEEKEEKFDQKRHLTGKLLTLLKLLSVITCIYHILGLFVFTPDPLEFRAIHIASTFTLGFMIFVGRKDASRSTISLIDWVLILLSICTMFYIYINAGEIGYRLSYIDPVTPIQFIFGIISLILVLELSRRAVGLPLAILVAISALYVIFGPYIPGPLSHAGVTPKRFIEFMYLTSNGIFGSTIGISSTYVISFIIFGSFLEKSGTGDFLLKMGISAARNLKGGPAKSAVIASTVMGTTMGSAIANTYCTGQFTIPLMKEYGFKPKIAGAVEAVASTVSQIMPPVMSSAAFLIADVLGKSYGEVCIAGIVPALLYSAAIYMMVHLEAIKMGEPKTTFKTENLKKLVKDNWILLLPIVLLIYMLIQQYTAFYAALVSSFAAIVISWVKPHTRMNFTKIMMALETAAQRVVPMAVALAAAGVIVSSIQVTGLAVKFTKVLITISGGNLILMLIFIAISCIILGMGLPTPAAYLLTALFAGPTLVKMGIQPMVAHMFIFNFAILSVITPPVALAAYAGAEIAGENPNTVGWHAFRLGIAAYIIPFFFIFHPELLLQGELNLVAIITALIGIFSLAFSVQGWFFNYINKLKRIVLFITALMLFHPNIVFTVIGLSSIIILGLFELKIKTGKLSFVQGYRLLKGIDEVDPIGKHEEVVSKCI